MQPWNSACAFSFLPSLPCSHLLVGCVETDRLMAKGSEFSRMLQWNRGSDRGLRSVFAAMGIICAQQDNLGANRRKRINCAGVNILLHGNKGHASHSFIVNHSKNKKEPPGLKRVNPTENSCHIQACLNGVFFLLQRGSIGRC